MSSVEDLRIQVEAQEALIAQLKANRDERTKMLADLRQLMAVGSGEQLRHVASAASREEPTHSRAVPLRPISVNSLKPCPKPSLPSPAPYQWDRSDSDVEAHAEEPKSEPIVDYGDCAAPPLAEGEVPDWLINDEKPVEPDEAPKDEEYENDFDPSDEELAA